MKQNNALKMRFLLSLLAILATIAGYATQLSGSVSINPGGTASGTVFKNYNSLITYLSGTGARSDGGPANTAPFGLSGNLTVNVASAIITDRVTIPSTITGLGTYQLKFLGASKTGTILQYATSAVTDSQYVVRISGAKNVAFESMTIRSTATVSSTMAAVGIHVMGTSSLNSTDDIVINNCVITMPAQTSATYSSYVAGVVVNGSTSYTSFTSGGYSKKVRITNNTFNYGYYNLYLRGASSTTLSAQDATVTGNTFTNSLYYSVYAYYATNLNFSSNTLTQNSTSAFAYSYGLYMYYCNGYANALAGGNGGKTTIRNNTFSSIGAYGIYCFSSNGQSTAIPNEVTGNVMLGNFRNTASYYYPMYFSSTGYTNIAHNTAAVNWGYSTTSYGVLGITSGNYLKVYNNTFLGYGTSNAIYLTTSNTNCTIDYNNFYNYGDQSATAPVMYYSGTATVYNKSNFLTTGAAAVNAGSVGMNFGPNNVFVNQGWAGLTNLTGNDACVRGASLATAGITVPSTDVNAVTRDVTAPTIGAYQVSGVSDDAGIVNVSIQGTAGNQVLVGGNQVVKVLVRNSGSNTLTSVTLQYTVNSVTTSQTFSGLSLAPCASDTMTFTTPFTLNSGCTSVAVQVNDVNGTFDNNSNNDVGNSGNVGIPIAVGTYTINSALPPSSTNFTSFANFMASAGCAGVYGTGNVIVNVNGIYNEQVAFGVIPGLSATTRLIFQGTDTVNSVIAFAGTSTFPHTIRFNTGAKYITFQDMGIRGLNATNAYPVHFFGDATGIQIKRCNIFSAASTAYTNVPVMFASSVSTYSPGVACNDVLIDQCFIHGGTDGISIYSTSTSTTYTPGQHNTNIRFTNNTIVNQNGGSGWGSIHMRYVHNATVTGNFMGLNAAGIAAGYVGGYYGTYFISLISTSGFPTRINNNIINAAQTSNAYYISSSNGSVGAGDASWNEFVNNQYAPINGETQTYGLYMTSSTRWKIYHNTIYNNNVSTSSYGAYISGSVTDSLKIMNNAFIASTGTPLYMSYTLDSTKQKVWYNNFYNNGGTNLAQSGTMYLRANLSSFGYANVNMNQRWNSSADLNINEGCANGINLGYTTDAAGTTRSANPDMGALEVISLPAFDISVSEMLQPTNPTTASSQVAKVVVKNNGTATINSFNVYYSINGVLIGSEAITGVSIAPCDTKHVVFSTPFTPQSGCNTFSAFTILPNGTADANTSNDSLTASFGVSMTGTLTLNPSATPSATTFNTFNDLLTALSCSGVGTGGVTVNVTGVFTEQWNLVPVPGASATNRIRLVGTDTASAIVRWNATASPYYVINVSEGANYWSIENMGIQGAYAGATTSYAIYSYGINATGLTVKKCRITHPTGTTNSYYPYYIYSYATTQSDYLFDSNTVIAGYYGVYLYGLASATGSVPTTRPTNFTVSNNTFEDIYYYGGYLYCTNGLNYINNRVTMRTGNASSYGAYVYYNSNSPARAFKYNNNVVKNWGSYGMYVMYLSANYFNSPASTQYGNAFGRQAEINGNVITGSGASQPFYGNYMHKLDMYHNTFATSSATFAVQINNSGTTTYKTDSANIVNNTFITQTATDSLNTGTGNYPAWINVDSVNTIDANNYLVLGNPEAKNLVLAYISTNRTTGARYYNGNPAATNINYYKKAMYSTPWVQGAGANSVATSQGISSISNPVPSDGCVNGLNVPTVTTDFLGNTRATLPDIGAYEVPSASNDATVSSVVSPVGGVLTAQPVTAVVKNNGSVPITSVTLGYRLNGGSLTTETFSGLSIAVCDTATVYFSSTATVPGGCNNFQVIVTGLNGGADGNAVNDTTTKRVSSPMSGTYTIGATASDYSTISAAVDALVCSGVNGPVTFNIANGIYNEFVTVPNITGATSTNNITFKSATGNRDSVIITAATGTNLAVFKVVNAQYLTLKDVTVVNTVATTSSRAVEVNGANVVSFLNVAMINPTTTTTTYTFYNYTTGSDSVTIQGCYLSGSYYSLYNYGSSTARHTYSNIIGNTIANAYYYGIMTYYNDGAYVKNNIVSNFTNTTSYGLYSYYAYNDVRSTQITGNRVRLNGGYGYYGVYPNYSGAATRGLFANNMISIGAAGNSSVAYGMYILYPRNFDYWHNSVRVEGTSTCYGAYYSQTYTGAITNTFYNNNIANFGNTASAYGFYYGATTPTYDGTLLSDSNNIYSVASGNVAYFSGTASTYSSLSAYTAATGAMKLDSGSVSVMPQFQAVDDLHLSGASHATLGNRGKVIASVTTDIDGQTRCPNVGCPGTTSLPDLGADEFEPLAADAGATAVITNSFCPGVSGPVTIRVKNFSATDTMTSVNINWELSTNGGAYVAQTPFAATGLSVLPNATSDVVVGNLTLSVGNFYRVRANTSDPNGVTDLNNVNDSVVGSIFSAALSGTITVGGSSPTYPSLDLAFADLAYKGVCGPTTVLVRSANITTPLQLNNVPGASATNTIMIMPDTAATVNIAVPTNATSGSYALNINQADYVTIKGFNISRTGSNTYGWVVLLSGGNDGVELRNNTITAPTGTTSLYVPVYNSSSANDTLTDVKIVGNTITNGYYGMYIYGGSGRHETRLSIDSNTFDGQYYYGFYGYYIGAGIKIRYNNIYKNANSNTTNYGFTAYYGSSNATVGQAEIAYNNVISNNLAANTTYGIYGGYYTGGISIHDNYVRTSYRPLYMYGNTWDATAPTYKTRIYNNQFIQENNTSALQGAVYIASNGTTMVGDIVHNNIDINHLTGSGSAAVVLQNAGVQDSLVFANNNIYTGAGAIPALIYGTPGANGLVDRNNYNADNSTWYAGVYNPTGGVWTVYSDKSSWYAATGMDTNSVRVDPGYLSATDLHVTNQLLDGTGIYLPDYPTDMDGQARNSTTPDIGADEFTPSPYDVAVLSSPYPAYVGGCTASATDSIVIRLKNFGTSTVTFGSGDSLYAVITGVNPQTYGVALSGSIISGGTMDVTVTNSYNLSIVGTHTIDAYGVFTSFADGFAGNNNMAERSVYRPASVTANNTTPYNQGFEGDITTSWLNSGTKNWITRSGAGSTTTTGPGSAFQGSKYLVVPNTGATTIDNYIIESPCMDLSAMGCAAATFRTHMYGANIGTLRLEASTNGGQTWSTVWSKVGQQQASRATAWTLNTVDVAQYATSSTSFRFRYDGIIGTSTMEVAVDTFRISPSTTTTLAADANRTNGSTCNVFNFVDRTSPASVTRKWKISPPNFTLYGGSTLYDSILKVTFTNSGAYVVSLDTVTTICGNTQVGPGTSTKIISIAAPTGSAGVWTGAQDADWNNGCNWADGNAPGSGIVITIPANMPNYPSISGNITVNDLSVASGANFDITTGNTVTVLGNVNVSGLVTGNGNLKIAGSGNQNITAGYMPSTVFGKDTTSNNQNLILSGSQYGLVLDFARQATLQSVDVKINNLNTNATVVLRNSSNVTLFSTTVTPNGTNSFQTVNLGWTVPAGIGYKLVMITPSSGSASYGMSTSGITYPYAASNYVNITSSWTGSATTTTSYYHFFNVRATGGTTLANLNLEKTSGDVVLQDNVGAKTLTLNVGDGKVASSGVVDQDLQTNYDNIYITDGSASAVTRVGGTDSTNYIQGRVIRQVSAGATGTYLFPVGFYNAKGDTTDRRNGKVKGFYSPMAIQFTSGSATDGSLTGSYYDYDPMWYTGNINNRDTVAGAYDLFDSVSGGAVDVKMNALWRVENSGLTNFVYNWEVAGATFDSTGNVGDELAGSTLRLVKKEVWNSGNWGFQGNNAVAGLISGFTAKNAARRDSLTSFSSVSVAGNGRGKSGEGLPVEFVSFTAKKVDRNAVLTWVTAAEINVNAFVIERSIDGKNFEEIGRKNPQGPSTYNFTDLRPVAGTNYYRIKTIDNDGSIGYSPVRSLQFTDAISSMNVFPNPFVSNLGVELNASKAGVAQITIMDVTGRKVLMSVNSNVKNGKNFIQLPQADELATGSYLLKVEFAGDVVWTKLVKN